MTGPPKLKRGNDRDQDVQYQRGWPDGRGYETEQRHHGDVAGCAGVTDAGIEERDYTDGEKQQNEMRDVHSLSGPSNDEARMVRAGLALNDEGMTKHQ
jgi:hypothetical protein